MKEPYEEGLRSTSASRPTLILAARDGSALSVLRECFFPPQEIGIYQFDDQANGGE